MDEKDLEELVEMLWQTTLVVDDRIRVKTLAIPWKTLSSTQQSQVIAQLRRRGNKAYLQCSFARFFAIAAITKVYANGEYHCVSSRVPFVFQAQPDLETATFHFAGRRRNFADSLRGTWAVLVDALAGDGHFFFSPRN